MRRGARARSAIAAAGRWVAERRSPTLALAGAILSVAAATLAIYPLRSAAPVAALSVVYLPAVLLVSTLWGLWAGLFTAVLSSAAFNFFHIPPFGRFSIANSRNWVGLAAFAVVAAVASTISELARSRAVEAERRRAEADLAAAVARELLSAGDTSQALSIAGRRLVQALELPFATLALGTGRAGERREAFPLHDGGGHHVATLFVPRDLPADVFARLRDRVVPTLEALVAIALRRDQLQAEAVETEALRRSDDVKTALLRAVSHDLRTPLTAIVATGHALSSPSLTDDDRRELGRAVVEEGDRLASLVEKLLDLSVLQAGARPREEWMSVEDVIEAARHGLGAGTDLRVSLAPGLPELRGDPTQLERALANLLENAARYSRTVAVNVRSDGRRLVLSVVDQGPGIPPAERVRIFEPFYRGSGQASGTGSGLGLAIAKGFVEAAGGTIAVESLPGQGTSFVVTLPVQPRAGAVAAPSA